MVAGACNGQIEFGDNPTVKHMLKVREEYARQQKKDYSHVFRTKSRFDFIRLSCIVVGIELAYAAETAFVSPILLQIGVEHQHMTMVWSLSSLLGFFLAPLIGSFSDRCHFGIGRRRPIIIFLSMGILAGLLLVPYGRDIGIMLGDTSASLVESRIETIIETNTTTNIIASALVNPDSDTNNAHYKYAVILIVLGTVLLDFDADTCQTPSRAYILDVCVPQDHAKALSTFTILAGLGGTLGYAIGGVNWEETQIGDLLGGNIETVFAIVTVIFVICFIITITSFREIPLNLIEKDELLRPLTAASIKKEIAKNINPIYYIPETQALELKMSDMNVTNLSNDKQLTNSTEDFSINTAGKDLSLSICEDDEHDDESITLTEYLKSIVIMPKSMRFLCLTNLLCWMGHVCYCLYFTDFVGEAVFHGDPQGLPGSTEKILYEEGLRFGCWGMSIYAFSCAIFSSLVTKLIRYFSTRTVYIGGILTYAIGMLILAAWPTKVGVLVLSTTAGVIYATLFTMPYILVAKYHAQGCFKVKSGENIPLKQTRGLGTDIAIISSMVFIAQFIVSLSAGWLVTAVNTTAAVLYAASILSIGAAISAMKVLYLD